CRGRKSRSISRILKRFRKIAKIGPLGAVVGFLMRPCYKKRMLALIGNHQTLEELALTGDIEVNYVDFINSYKTKELFEKLNPDVGVSISNSFISKNIFSIPRFGMVNIHHELLPEFKGAASTFWQIYKFNSVTGYTIHTVTDKIDGGDILFKKKIPIHFKSSLCKTISYNYAQSYMQSIYGMSDILSDFYKYYYNRQAQIDNSVSYTTPTFSEYVKAKINHYRLSRITRGT
ncbi:MAG: formyltransferase family protein, partial [Pseudomonadota bacterium]|nr:formyltransferase family protein [Pseudomonadota bacterium]